MSLGSGRRGAQAAGDTAHACHHLLLLVDAARARVPRHPHQHCFWAVRQYVLQKKKKGDASPGVATTLQASIPRAQLFKRKM